MKKLNYVFLSLILVVYFLDAAGIPGAPVIRLNQAGYLPEDNYKTAVVAGLSGSFEVRDYDTDEVVYTGNLTQLGTDPGTGETLYLADFSDLTREGVYYIKVGSESSYKFEIKKDLYNKVLYYVLRVYGANRCGPYDSWIHQPCHTKDGVIRGQGKDGSLAGGWHDCGDHVKFGHTVFYAACALLFAYNAWPDRFGDVYGMSYDGTYYNPKPDGIPDVLNEVKVVTDYMLNLYNASVEDGLIQQNKLYYQVGDGDDDHTWWHKPEYQDDFPQSRGGQPREAWSDIGADLAGRFAAALAMMATAYYKFDIEYANRCLEAAKNVYNIGKNVYGLSGRNSGGKGYYQPDNRADDDMALAAVELYKATGDPYYLQEAQYWMAIENKWQFCSYYVLSFPNVFAFVLYDYYPYASTVDNAPSEVDTKIVTKDECLEWLERDVFQSAPEPDIYGRKWDYGWGTCRYMMGVAATACMAYDLSLKRGQPNANSLKVAKDQTNWVFGRNQFGMSFIIGNQQDGWLTRYPQHPHHRAANPDGENVPELPPYPATELTGATIGGPKAHTDFSDRWDDYVATETGVDYWAGTLITAAYFAKPVSEITDTPPSVMFSTPTNNSFISGMVTIKILASDDKGVSKIELWIGNQKITEVLNQTILTYQWNTNDYPNDSYQLKAVAYDTSNQTSEKQITVTVNNTTGGGGDGGGGGDQPPQQTDNPPEVTFNLVSGSTVSGTVEVVVNVSDDVGISSVLFYINEQLIGSYTSSFSYYLDTKQYPNGPLSLKVIAYDSLNQSTTQQVLIYVNNVVGDEPPQVQILSPQDNDVVSGVISINYTYSDDKQVIKLELYINDSHITDLLLGSTYYELNTNVFSDGDYFLKIVAYDDANQVGISTVFIKIKNNQLPTNIQKEEKKHFILVSSVGSPNSEIDMELYFTGIKLVEIFNSSGKLIKKITSSPYKITYSLINKSGLYLCRISDTSGKVYYCTITCIK